MRKPHDASRRFPRTRAEDVVGAVCVNLDQGTFDHKLAVHALRRFPTDGDVRRGSEKSEDRVRPINLDGPACINRDVLEVAAEEDPLACVVLHPDTLLRAEAAADDSLGSLGHGWIQPSGGVAERGNNTPALNGLIGRASCGSALAFVSWYAAAAKTHRSAHAERANWRSAGRHSFGKGHCWNPHVHVSSKVSHTAQELKPVSLR